jgi:hypothetical protein
MDMSNIGFESEFEDLVDVCLFKFLWHPLYVSSILTLCSTFLRLDMRAKL